MRVLATSAMKPPMLEPRSAIGPGGSSAAIVADVIERGRPERAVALAVAALVEADRRHAGGAQRAGHVELVLLLRAGAVEHHHAARAVALGPEERVGQPVAGAQLGRAARRGRCASTWDHAARHGRAALSATSIRSAAASPRPGTSSSAAATPSRWRASSARPPTSSSRTTSATRARAFVEAYAARCEDFEVHFASKAFPCTAVLRILREEGLACDVASGGELAIALKAGFDPGEDPPARQREVRGRAGRGGGRRRRPRRRRQPHRHRPSRAPRARRRRRSASSCAWRPASAPTPTRRSPPAARTRSSASACSRRPPRSSASTPPTGSSSRACTCTSARRSTTSRASAPRWRRWPAWPATAWSTSAAASASPTSTPSTRRPSRSTSAAKVDAVRDVMGPGVRILDEPGRALVANSTVTLYTVQSMKRNVDLYVAVDGGMSDNLRPMLYGARYEAQIAVALRRRDVLPSRGQALRVGRPHRPRRRARRPAAWATSSSLRPPAPTASPCPTPTTACRARRSSSSRTATRAWSSAARPTRTCVARDVEHA